MERGSIECQRYTNQSYWRKQRQHFRVVLKHLRDSRKNLYWRLFFLLVLHNDHRLDARVLLSVFLLHILNDKDTKQHRQCTDAKENPKVHDKSEEAEHESRNQC
jgi:hypothetical protein